MGTPKATKNKLSKDGKSKEEEKNKEKKTAAKKKLKVDEKQVQQEKKKISKKKDNSSKNNGTAESKIRKQSNGNPNDSGNKRRRKKKNEEGNEEEVDEEEYSKLLNVFPINRVQRIAKSEGSDFKMSQEAYFLINKATEKFIGQFCEDAYASAPPRDRKGFFKYRNLSSVVSTEKRYDFLSDFVPEKIKVEDALKEIKPEEEP